MIHVSMIHLILKSIKLLILMNMKFMCGTYYISLPMPTTLILGVIIVMSELILSLHISKLKKISKTLLTILSVLIKRLTYLVIHFLPL